MLAGVTSNSPAATAVPNWLPGINLADGGMNSKGSRLYIDYTYPTAKQLDYFVQKGFRFFRVPVLGPRLLPPGSEKETADWQLIVSLIKEAEKRGAWILLDLHQYGGMPSGLVGRDPAATAEFVAFWKTVATRLKDQPNVMFGLMNEPNKQTAAEWLAGANAGIAAIREAGANQMVLVPGSSWDGASNWTRSANATTMGGVIDPRHNFAYEVHQYLDRYSSGTTKDVVGGSGATSLVAFTKWARDKKVRAFLGEFGFAATPEAMREGRDLVTYMAANKDVWQGWTYWAAGAWWGNYPFSVEPDKGGGDRPQLSILQAGQ